MFCSVRLNFCVFFYILCSTGIKKTELSNLPEIVPFSMNPSQNQPRFYSVLARKCNFFLPKNIKLFQTEIPVCRSSFFLMLIDNGLHIIYGKYLIFSAYKSEIIKTTKNSISRQHETISLKVSRLRPKDGEY